LSSFQKFVMLILKILLFSPLFYKHYLAYLIVWPIIVESGKAPVLYACCIVYPIGRPIDRPGWAGSAVSKGQFILASILMSIARRWSRSELELLTPRMTGQCGVDICGADWRIDEERVNEQPCVAMDSCRDVWCLKRARGVTSCPGGSRQDRRRKTSDLGGLRERHPAIFLWVCILCIYCVFCVELLYCIIERLFVFFVVCSIVN